MLNRPGIVMSGNRSDIVWQAQYTWTGGIVIIHFTQKIQMWFCLAIKSIYLKIILLNKH